MGVIRPPHQVFGMVPWLRIEFNNFSYTGISVSILAFIILLLILSENDDLLFFNFSAALRISLSVIMKSKGRDFDHGIHFVIAHCKCFATLG